MKLSIYSLQNILFQGTASSINCRTTAGEITILDKHEALITALDSGVIKIIANLPNGEKKEQFFPVKSGFLEIKPGAPSGSEVRCIVEQ